MLALIGSLAAGDVESGRASWLIVAISLILSTLLTLVVIPAAYQLVPSTVSSLEEDDQ